LADVGTADGVNATINDSQVYTLTLLVYSPWVVTVRHI